MAGPASPFLRGRLWRERERGASTRSCPRSPRGSPVPHRAGRLPGRAGQLATQGPLPARLLGCRVAFVEPPLGRHLDGRNSQVDLGPRTLILWWETHPCCWVGRCCQRPASLDRQLLPCRPRPRRQCPGLAGKEPLGAGRPAGVHCPLTKPCLAFLPPEPRLPCLQPPPQPLPACTPPASTRASALDLCLDANDALPGAAGKPFLGLRAALLTCSHAPTCPLP